MPLAGVRALLFGGVVALVLLVLGEAAPGLWPVHVALEVSPDQVTIDTDGSIHAFPSPIDRPWASVALIQPDPTEREYQIDGSDVTSRKDRDPDEIRAFEASPLYRVAAWLRDESSYSRWDDVRLTDTATGQLVAQGRSAVESAALPRAFRLEASLRRPEAAATLDLSAQPPSYHGVVEIGRDNKTVMWSVGERGSQEKGSWFFPEQAPPFAAELLQLLGRSAAAGYALLLVAWLLARLAMRLPMFSSYSSRAPGVGLPNGTMPVASAASTTGTVASGSSAAPLAAFRPSFVLPWALALVGGLWLVAAAWVSIRLYHQLPHIIDANAYYFESTVLASGRLWFDAPPEVDAFKGFFETVANGRWFAQYPPGAPALMALGSLVGLTWLVGPLAGLVLIVCTSLAALHLFGRSTALAALGLAAISPFILFQVGSFMSHAVAGAALAAALAAFAFAERTRRPGWYAVAGACLGWGLLTRELSTVLFGMPLVIWMLVWRRWRGLALLVAAGLPFALAYLAYNAQLTGNPLLLPRNAVNASDVYGFGRSGDTIHTLAAGLDYADQNLTLLQFDLFGWPPLFAFGLMCLPFLLGKAGRYDVLLAGGVLVYLLGYLGVPGAGIVLGPRYYYEALPWLIVLAARGLQALALTLRGWGVSVVAARVGVVTVVGLLTLNTLLFYDPHLVARRTDYFAMDHNRGVALPFVQNTLFGPRLTGFDGPTLVFVPDDVVFKTLSALNCRDLDRQHIQSCPVLFAGGGLGNAAKLAAAYPGRRLYVARMANGAVTIEPYAPEQKP